MAFKCVVKDQFGIPVYFETDAVKFSVRREFLGLDVGVNVGDDWFVYCCVCEMVIDGDSLDIQEIRRSIVARGGL